MDKFRWQNRIEGEPLDICKVTLWSGDTGSGALCCEICDKKDLDDAYTVIAEWGDTKHYETDNGWMCSHCARSMLLISRNAAQKTLEEVTMARQ